MKNLLLISLIITSIFVSSGKSIKVIDAIEGTPLQGATVIGKSGLIVGVTDANGNINISSLNQFPVSIRSLGFEPANIECFSDSVKLFPAIYNLNEIVVGQYDRPIKRVVCFVREYATGATGTDTMQLYSEYMMESFLKDGEKKVKGYKSGDASPKVRNMRRYTRFTNSKGLDSVSSPKGNDDITMLSWSEIISVPDYKFRERRSIMQGATTDTVMGKYGPGSIFRKQNGIYSVTFDHMSEYKDHKWSPLFFKLVGMSMDVQNMMNSLAYKVNESSEYSFDDFIYGTYSIHLLAKGKIFKKIFHTDNPIDMDSYIELYPISVTYLTPEEYKEARSDKEPIPFQTTSNIQPLPTSIQTIVERVENKD
ncbi:MAG: carboxypeptidase-like regulatory domain-containing protein [Muribaculaceae bacterium]|nr:carboxypeptidase-like regulatory domain-containing protein [Muribaculaceae bacterium]